MVKNNFKQAETVYDYGLRIADWRRNMRIDELANW